MKKLLITLLMCLPLLAMAQQADSLSFFETLQEQARQTDLKCVVKYTAYADAQKQVAVDTSTQIIISSGGAVYVSHLGTEVLHTDSFTLFINHTSKEVLLERKHRAAPADMAKLAAQLYASAGKISFSRLDARRHVCTLAYAFGPYTEIKMHYDPSAHQLLQIDYLLNGKSEKMGNAALVVQQIHTTPISGKPASLRLDNYLVWHSSAYQPSSSYKSYRFYNRF